MKTLRDIKFKTHGYEDDGTTSSAPYQKEDEIIKNLQEVAREWIKHLEEEYMYWLDKFNIYQPALIFGIDEKTKKRKKDEEFEKNQIEKSLQFIGGQIWWINKFFNLYTDEE